MTEPQGVTTEAETEGVTAEAQEQDVKNIESEEVSDKAETDKAEADLDEDADDSEEAQETVEDRLARLEKEDKSKQKAIDRKTAALADANRKMQEQAQALQELQAKLQPVQTNPEPSIDDYDDFESYNNALTDYKVEQRLKEQSEKMQQQQMQAKQQELAAERQKVADAHKAEYLQINPKYEKSEAEFNSFISSIKVNPQVEQAIVEQAFEGNVAQVIDYFGANMGERLDELEAITKMSPTKAAVEIYKLQQRLGKPVKQETKPPPKPVNSPSSNAKSKKSLKDLSGEELLKQLGLKG